MRSVALYGLAPCLGRAPDSWETWALLWDKERYLAADRLFDPHQEYPEKLGRICSQHAENVDCPVYVTEERDYGLKYPIDSVIDEIGDYFSSSCAYMLGLAIHEGVDQIGLWGFEMADRTEYQFQRANCEYLIGFARGRGIDVYIAPGSALLTIDRGAPHCRNGRYGWHSPIMAS